MTKSSIKILLRWLFATSLTLFGCWIYLAAPMIGSGVHLDPMPGPGMLFAGAALVVMIAGYWLIRSQKKADILAIIINIVLILGAVSLIYGVAEWAYDRIYRLQSSDWGHSRPGEVLFRVSYGTLSVAGLAVFNYWVRAANIPTQP